MGPKFDPTAVYESTSRVSGRPVGFLRVSFAVMVRVTGGEAPGGSSLAPKIGPLGLVSTALRSSAVRSRSLLSPNSHPRRSVMTLPKPRVTGKACESP